MKSVLLTAFEPYDRYPTNASWLTLVELTRSLPTDIKLTTRLYPVDYAKAREMVQQDLLAEPDYAIHLGQAPGSGRLRLETTGLNTSLRGQDHAAAARRRTGGVSDNVAVGALGSAPESEGCSSRNESSCRDVLVQCVALLLAARS